MIRANNAAGILASRTKAVLLAADRKLWIISKDIWSKSTIIDRERRQGKPPKQASFDELSAAKEERERRVCEYLLDKVTYRIKKLFLADMR